MRSRGRVALAVCLGTAVVVIGIALVAVDSSGSRVNGVGTYAVQPPSRLGRDLGVYIRRPGDEVVVVPDGRYTVGEIKAPHPETTGPMRGWLVLVAQTQGQVVVDLADASFVLHAGTSRVMFVGMRFINGTISVRGAHDIVFWYTDHSFDPHVWRRQFDAAGGNKAALRRIPHYSPTTVRIGLDGSALPERTSFFGSDFHDVGDDAIFVTGQIGGTVTGVRAWDVNEAGVDPGFGGNGPGGDLIHNDSIQTSGGLQHFAVTDSYLGQRIQWGAQTGSNHDTQFAHLWIAGSQGFGMILDTANNRSNTGSMNTIRAWGNGTGTVPYDPAFDRFRIDIFDGQRRVWPATFDVPGRVELPATNVLDQAPPSGVRMDGGRMVDVNDALDQPDNPALVWRAQHPYDSWPSYFSFKVPTTTQP